MRPKRFLSVIAFGLVFLFVSQGASFALTGKEIVKKSEDAMRGNTQIALYSITIKTRRWKRTMKMKTWESRKQKKTFTEITAPKKDAGNRFLLINKTMRHYVPKLSKVIKISPSMMLQSWMGSDFSNDDIVKESSKIEDYTHNLVGKVAVRGNLCYKVELTPKPGAAVVWGKITYYARVKDILPVKEEFYNERGVLKKVMTYSRFKKMHDRVIPTKMVMKTVKKRNRYTMMVIKKARFNVAIPARKFTLQNLKRR
ncbi:MAG: outer membrane lipoprotein-sorting protein [bacterium]|nr:outer membrane lipoprotein-sorting protein [bacterium]